MEALQDTLLQLEQVNANILGFILNDVESKSSYGKYGYKYGRSGKYSYSKYNREYGMPKAASKPLYLPGMK
jgi:Mrp family chromosome partitioning ATPase